MLVDIFFTEIYLYKLSQDALMKLTERLLPFRVMNTYRPLRTWHLVNVGAAARSGGGHSAVMTIMCGL
jgi:hypothetical protein